MTEQRYSSSLLAGVSSADMARRVAALVRCAFVAAFLLGAFVVHTVSAQEQGEAVEPSPSGEITIGIVDMAAVMQSSDVIAILRQTFDEQNLIFQSEISQEEIALRDAEKQINEERENLTEDEFRTRLAEFENRVVALQRKIQSERNSFDSAYLEAQARLEQELRGIITEIAAEKGFSIVLDRNTAVLFDTALDISDEALARLNERMRDVTITLERTETP